MHVRLILLALLVAGACTSPPAPVVSPAPAPAPRDTTTANRGREQRQEPPAPPLPPVPSVTGPLAIKVVYPAPNHLIESRDSNFIFGSVGNGQASLTINGATAR